MGHGLSCSRDGEEHDFFRAAQVGDLDALDALLGGDPSLASRTTMYDRLSVLHIAAANGQVQVLSMFLERRAGAHPDVLNRSKQSPLMLAAMHGKLECVLRLLEAGANILMFDSVHARTCLHHAAYHGHGDCLRAVLSAARTSAVAESWGFARLVNLRDEHGATPLHLAARQGRPECVNILLDSGAIVSSGGGGTTALHLAARGGKLECVRELLAWGADRLARDSAGRIAYAVALKRRHRACAALLNPAAAEPMVWPSPLKFIGDLNPEAKALLQAALRQANRDTSWETTTSIVMITANDQEEEEDSNDDLCGICLEQACSIEVQDCGHQMCAACTLALCCHCKPNPTTLALQPPACPFCRTTITRLLAVVAAADDDADNNKTNKKEEEADTPRLSRRRSRRPSFEGSSSFKGLSSAISRIGRGSGRFADDKVVDKPEHDP